jgi:3-oxoacyl-[acyl-carrier protein] reductase
MPEQVVIVTGGAKGLGLAYVRAIAAAGSAVVIADLSDPSPLAEELTAAGQQAFGLQVDISDEASTARMADATLERFGRIDALINNAGYFTQIHKQDFDTLTVEQWELALRVNVIGTWLCCRAVAPAMKRQGSGRIVNTSSMTVPTGIPGFLHYVSSKAAVVGLTRGLARELGPHGVTVNTISPDYVPHDADYAGRQPEMAGILTAQRCIQRDAVPDDLVGTVMYLIGPGAGFVTGQDFWVNGGRAFH